ncbi:MAG: hypothetical protein IPP77_03350 [Bacteroidetes bacterium]|nr:hypothetical protein [Bacteroidota bacterium]
MNPIQETTTYGGIIIRTSATTLPHPKGYEENLIENKPPILYACATFHFEVAPFLSMVDTFLRGVAPFLSMVDTFLREVAPFLCRVPPFLAEVAPFFVKYVLFLEK